jgi:hypothetical protein
MIAGVIGLILSLTGLAGTIIAKPILATTMNITLDTLANSIETSQRTLDITDDALSATINSIDALSEMLDATALTVEDTQPVINKLNIVMANELPETINTATVSLTAAEGAAGSLESAIKSFEVLQTILGSTPFLSAVLPPAGEPYNPEKSLAESLGDLSKSMEDMPETFIGIAADLDKADENLVMVKDSMILMSVNVSLISDSLTQYKSMISQSKTSTDNLKSILTGFQSNLPNILNITSIVLILFFLWLMAMQVVIFSQGWELYQGTADGMASNQSISAKMMGNSESTANENKNELTSDEPSVVKIDSSENESDSEENKD